MCKKKSKFKSNKSVFISSCLLTVIPILFGRFYRISQFNHELGYPFASVKYFGEITPQYNYQIFLPRFIGETSINGFALLLSFLAIYVSLKIIQLIILNIFKL